MTTLNRDEKSLLLFLETRAVDYSGRVATQRMNADDWQILKRWTETGFIESGRIASDYLSRDGSHWVLLSEEAVSVAHRLRRERATRCWANKAYLTTAEKRNAPVAASTASALDTGVSN
ncbi:MAG: hypothetical protein AAGC60_00130 [Acidobacteriota bacterium]